MQHAYNQSINAWNADEVPVGAVIVHNEEIIASAHNQTRTQKDPKCSRGNDRYFPGCSAYRRLASKRM